MPLSFNDYLEIAKEEFAIMVETAREFVKNAQDRAKLPPSARYQQYQTLLESIGGSTAFVIHMGNEVWGEGKGQKYVDEMEAYKAKLEKDQQREALTNGL